MDVVAGLTIAPLVVFLGVAFVQHPGAVLVEWVRTMYSLCLIATQAASILLPSIGRPLYLCYFVAGANLGVKSNARFVCACVFALMVLDARFLEVAATLPLNHAIALLSVAFFLGLAPWTLVRDRESLFAEREGAKLRLGDARIAAIVFNWYVLACVIAADVVPMVGTGLLVQSGTDPVMLIASFVLGRNADRHAGIFSVLSILLLVVASVSLGTQSPLALAPMLPLLVGNVVFFLMRGGQRVSRDEVLLAIGVLAWSVVVSFLVYVVCVRPASVPGGFALAVGVLCVAIAVALLATIVSYADHHNRVTAQKRPP